MERKSISEYYLNLLFFNCKKKVNFQGIRIIKIIFYKIPIHLYVIAPLIFNKKIQFVHSK